MKFYSEAIETRLEWIKYVQETGMIVSLAKENNDELSAKDKIYYEHFYGGGLIYGDTFFMNEHFCDLVDHARKTIPLDLIFNADSLISKRAWMYLAKPFTSPRTSVVTEQTVTENVSAVAWCEDVFEGIGRAYWFGCYGEPSKWLILQDGKQLPNRHTRPYFVAREGVIVRDGQKWQDGRTTMRVKWSGDQGHIDINHDNDESKWIGTAIYLMAQRLTAVIKHPIARASRRRLEKEKVNQPPFIQVISLRRLEADKPQNLSPKDVDWQWQWIVRGHWRQQWYQDEGVHKPLFIESYVKGPEDKPMKPPSTKVFAAVR